MSRLARNWLMVYENFVGHFYEYLVGWIEDLVNLPVHNLVYVSYCSGLLPEKTSGKNICFFCSSVANFGLIL